MKKFLPIPAAFGYFTVFVLIYLALGYDWYRNKQAPDQPIAFSHKIHVGRVGLDCRFCHETVDKSTYAGIPSVQKCMSCHANVATDRPEVQKLAGYWERQEAMEWNRVHRIRIRNHVYFSHKSHIRAGIDCADCHGEVRYMDKVRQVSSLEMGWCVSCHQSKNASTDCLTCHM
ncbi:MAG: cytochrome c family protein [Candidatus Krumholzibacteria bacterium]|nr:cytochrome c family protein [Candidatus Krumholzibacteria bacterium]